MFGSWRRVEPCDILAEAGLFPIVDGDENGLKILSAFPLTFVRSMMSSNIRAMLSYEY